MCPLPKTILGHSQERFQLVQPLRPFPIRKSDYTVLMYVNITIRWITSSTPSCYHLQPSSSLYIMSSRYSDDSEEAVSYQLLDGGARHEPAQPLNLVSTACFSVLHHAHCHYTIVLTSRRQAAQSYEEHVTQNGKPANHTAAVELLAGLVLHTSTR